MIKFHIITIFPEVFEKYVNTSMLWRAQKEKLVEFHFYNPRDFTKDKHRKVDGRPYGGGPGMVMTVQPIIDAVEAIRKSKRFKIQNSKFKIILMSPAGKQFTNTIAKTYSTKFTDIVIICGHYEGIDARVKKILRAEEITIGPYVLTGGEVPAMVIADAVSRQIPGVLGNDLSLEESRVSSSETYTRPEIFEHKKKKYRVPKILLSGHRAKIDEWKAKRKKF